MASTLVFSSQEDNNLNHVLNSYMSNLRQMEIETIGLISECASFQRTKQMQIKNAKSRINQQFELLIQKIRLKQQQYCNNLDSMIYSDLYHQSALSAMTAIINDQKQNLNKYLSNDHCNKNNSNHHTIKQIDASFNESKQAYDANIVSIQQSLSTASSSYNSKIDKILKNAMSELQKFEPPSNEVSNKSLSKIAEYTKLNESILPNTPFNYQYAKDCDIPFVTAINILIEYLPNKIIEILFDFLPNKPQNFITTNYLKSGWNANAQILCDNPQIFIDHILPIQNQPSLILTIGLPGSGKTTWAKLRNHSHPNTVIAADDYFEEFNGNEFNPKLLGKAHEWAQNKIFNALKSGYSVCANNTNLTLSECYAYVSMVIFGHLPHKIVFAIMPEQNLTTLTRRNLHNVPYKKVKDMLQRMKYSYHNSPPSVYRVLRAGEFRRFRAKGTSNDVLYNGVFLEKEIQSRLRSYFVSVSSECLLSEVTDCHLTLKWQPLVREVDRLPFGKKVRLKVIGYARHEYIQCFLIDILDDEIRKMCVNKYAHITVSYNKDRVRANYSNHLLDNGKVIPVINNFDVENCAEYDELYRDIDGKSDGVNGGLIIEGTVGAFYKNPHGGVWFERRKKTKKRSRDDFDDNQW